MPFGSTMRPLLLSAAARSPESSTAKVSPGWHQLPNPCFGIASEQNGERGERYSFLKICVTLSLKMEAKSTGSHFVVSNAFSFQFVAMPLQTPSGLRCDRMETWFDPGKYSFGGRKAIRG